ncbi:programmed cell death 2 [Olea europaea subsp. europaea]|uniref:Programmed cell death 2 n=1 Tax=Olea europaea subsp. europaea TaxID=158383 RepID=A0A8S0Q7V8_OLEEU|nr:programmed cell death 2 [Olea europaea subsp. europaea]
MEFDANEGKFKTLRISSLDEEEDDEAQVDEIDDPDLYNDEDEDDEERVLVTLGFVEKPKNKWSLLRHYFPSKAGGTSAWLDPINLPSEKANICDFCSEPLQFLLQVYAPLSEGSTFHRTLFVFMCPSMTCLLRDQHDILRSHAEAKLCNWCGTWKGDKVCSSCCEARYCSGKHQAAHWRSGLRIGCTQLHTSLEMSKSVSGNRVDESVKSLMDDFAEIISRAPEQVLRYCRSAKAKALWPVYSGQPSRSDIPACNYCGGTRGVDFQVLPQLLYYFGVQNDVDSLDWATIVVYTCEASCIGEGYKEEFAWVQLASQSAP